MVQKAERPGRGRRYLRTVAAGNFRRRLVKWRDAAVSVGAFALAAGSRDAALIATLSPGAYSAQVSGVNNTTGVALIEVYDLP